MRFSSFPAGERAAASGELGAGAGEFAANLFRGGAAGLALCGERAGEADGREEVLVEQGREAAIFVEREVVELAALLDGEDDDAADDFVGLSEFEPLANEIVGQIGGVGVIADRGGAGTLAKLVNNQIFLCAGLLLQEGFVLAAKAGLDASRLLEVVRASSGAAYAGLAELTFARTFEQAFFTLALAEKDVALALASADALGVPMPVTSAAHATYARAAEAGHGAKSFLATLLAIEAAAGTEVGKLAK